MSDMTFRSHDFFDILRDLNLPEADYAIFGSAPLYVRGIINEMNDLDVICRGGAWDVVQAKGKLEYLEEYDVTIVTLLNGDIAFGTKWGIGDPDINHLIDNAEGIEGLPFVQLTSVLDYKRIRANPKDLDHIRLVEETDCDLALKT